MEPSSPLENKMAQISRPTAKLVGVRHFQALLLFTGITFGYFLRVNISAAIVPMTTPSRNPETPYYYWETTERSVILSSFFWGYAVAQIPAGVLAKNYGPKIVLSIATIFCSIFTILIPIGAAIGSWQTTCLLRVLIGLTQGTVYPCIHTLLAKWVPCTERGFLSTAVYSGAQLGSAIILATSGSIFDSNISWPGIFYFSGLITLIWGILFSIFGANSPDDVTYITLEEKKYITQLTGSNANTKDIPIPWKALFTSKPFYALIMAHCGFTWGFYTLLTEMPTYLNQVLLLDVKANALISALPYFAMWMMCFVVSPISDALNNHNILSRTASRKIFNSIGQWIPMICLIALGYMSSEEKTAAIILLTLAVGLNAASCVGYLVNHMDLAPNFAGSMMGITNGIANLLSIFAPLIVGIVVRDESDPASWRIVFYITGGIYFLCNLVFVIFGSGTVQKWNDVNVDSTV